MGNWLEFKVSCSHSSDQFDWCPLCRIAELKSEREELRATILLRERAIAELERKCDLLLTAANTWQDKHTALLDRLEEYTKGLDGLTGSPMWRIRTDIQKIISDPALRLPG